MEGGNKLKEYALYKGEDLLSIGTIQEIAEEMKVSKETIKYYGTPAHRKRTGERARRLVKLEGEEE